MPTHVHVWSHRLHGWTIDKLKFKYGEDIEITEINYHNEDRKELVNEIEAVIDRLRAEGKFQGRVVLVPPSTSVATALVTIATQRESGLWPDIVNLAVDDKGRYTPCYGLPFIAGQAFANKHRKSRAC